MPYILKLLLAYTYKLKFCLLFFIITISNNTYAQEIQIQVVNKNTNESLPYANVINTRTKKGTITNEDGYFSIDTSKDFIHDTIQLIYIGYKPKKIALAYLNEINTIKLDENIININEIFIFQNEPDPLKIIQKVLENIDRNYTTYPVLKNVFIRDRKKGKTIEFNINYKKSSIIGLGSNFFKKIEDKVPENFLNYTDILTKIYEAKVERDSTPIKINPTRIVELKEKRLDGLNDLMEIFDTKLESIDKSEYWKFKSGIFGTKIPTPDIQLNKLADDEVRVKDYSNKIKWKLKKMQFSNKKTWHFLHKPKYYNFILTGGTTIHGQDVYIIDFEPFKKGKFEGRMYVTTNDFAIIKADYFMPKEKQNHTKLLGIHYYPNEQIISIAFKKNKSHYTLKYFSEKTQNRFGVDRPISLIKKKENGLFDKKIDEVKVDLKCDFETSDSFEYFVLDQQEIDKKSFINYSQKKISKKINVNQFDKALWNGFSIIEPTDYMRSYEKKN